MRKEIELANKIIKKVRDKENKTNKDYEAIIDLSYLVTIISENKETEQSNYILERLRTGYYDEVKDEVKAEELNLSDDNIQYCFF